ncbi:MAG: asparagine synthetase B, partial [Methanobacteriota archaeon]
MCGIFGHIGYIEPEQVRRCTNNLRHRGPDGYGEWLSPEASFGHRRLAILDLSEDGRQPMVS